MSNPLHKASLKLAQRINFGALILSAVFLTAGNAVGKSEGHCLCIINDMQKTYTVEVENGKNIIHNMTVDIQSQGKHAKKTFQKQGDWVCLDEPGTTKIDLSFKHTQPWTFTVSPATDNCGTDNHSYVQLTCAPSGAIQATLFTYDPQKHIWTSEIVKAWTQPTVEYCADLGCLKKGQAALFCQ